MCDIIQDKNNQLYYSVLSMNEIAIKASIGKLHIGDGWQKIYQTLLQQKDILLLNLCWQAVTELQNLPFHHRDPFDRMLIAQAIANDLSFISADKKCSNYALNVVW